MRCVAYDVCECLQCNITLVHDYKVNWFVQKRMAVYAKLFTTKKHPSSRVLHIIFAFTTLIINQFSFFSFHLPALFSTGRAALVNILLSYKKLCRHGY